MRIHALINSFVLLISLVWPAITLSAEPDQPGHQLLKEMGAHGQFVVPDKEARKRYLKSFRQLDANEDWELTIGEACRLSDEPIPKKQFDSADTDGSGILSHDEFNRHQLIRDEAISIFGRMDRNDDSNVTREEFNTGSGIANKQRAMRAFANFDKSEDGRLTEAEILPVWDEWARQEPPPVTARLLVKQKTYELPDEFQTAEFRERIQKEQELGKLPPSPRVRLTLELKNISNRPLAVWRRGHVDDPEIMIEGDGLVRPESLLGGGGSGGSTTPQPVIQPGKIFRIRIRSLNPQGLDFDHVYWTKPGEYQVSASYPVYENLPPHLPQLFPDQPKPTGKLKRFVVTSPPVTVVVTKSAHK